MQEARPCQQRRSALAAPLSTGIGGSRCSVMRARPPNPGPAPAFVQRCVVIHDSRGCVAARAGGQQSAFSSPEFREKAKMLSRLYYATASSSDDDEEGRAGGRPSTDNGSPGSTVASAGVRDGMGQRGLTTHWQPWV